MIIKKENIDEVLTKINDICEEYGIENDFDIMQMTGFNISLTCYYNTILTIYHLHFYCNYN